MTTTSDPKPEPRPTVPGYGDQGPAGGGRDQQQDDKTAETENEAEPVNDLGG